MFFRGKDLISGTESTIIYPDMRGNFEDAKNTSRLLFHFMRQAFAAVRNNHGDAAFYWKALLDQEMLKHINDAITFLDHEAPMDMHPAFRDPDKLPNIVANARTAVDGRRDALITMRFDKDTHNLPLHTHPSNRVLIIRAGSGFAYYCHPNDMPHVKREAVKVGDMMVFPSGIPHTFQAHAGITTATYHDPYISFEDDESTLKIGGEGWYPSMYRG